MRHDFLHNVDAAYLRQVEIDDYHVGQLLLDRAERHEAIRVGGDREPRDAQRVVEHFTRGAVVFDEQNRGALVGQFLVTYWEVKIS